MDSYIIKQYWEVREELHKAIQSSNLKLSPLKVDWMWYGY